MTRTVKRMLFSSMRGLPADVERIIGHQQQCRIYEPAASPARLRKQLERVKHRLARKDYEVYALQRRIAELQMEHARLR